MLADYAHRLVMVILQRYNAEYQKDPELSEPTDAIIDWLGYEHHPKDKTC